MKKICIEDCVKMQGLNKIFLVTRVNRTTICTIDQYGNEDTFFIKEVAKVLTRQKLLSLEFEEKTTQTQLTLF